MAIIPKPIYRFKAVSIRILADFIVELDKPFLNSYGTARTQNSLENPEKGQIGEIRLPSFETYHKAMVIKTDWYQHKIRHVNQWDRIGSPEINPYINGQLFSTRVLRPFKGERIVFNK